MEKGLNDRNSVSKMRKSYKKTHASKSSLDEAVLKHFDLNNMPMNNNIQSSLQYSIIRNSHNKFKSPTKSE